MTTDAAQAVLCNLDIVAIILDSLSQTAGSKESTLYEAVRINKAFYTGGIPLLYRFIEINRSYPPQPPTSYAIRLRGLQENPSLGRHVRRLDAMSVTVEQLNKLLTYLPSVVNLTWQPLSLQRGVLQRLPKLPESIDTLQILRPSREDKTYSYDLEALETMVSPLRNLKDLIDQDFTLPELLTVLKVVGKRLETLYIDRTYRPKVMPGEEECWVEIFDSVPNLRVLIIAAMVPTRAVKQFPASIRGVYLQCLEPPALLEVINRLKDPAWLPNLKMLPTFSGYKFTPQMAQVYGHEYFAALPSTDEVRRLLSEAIKTFGFREGPKQKYAEEIASKISQVVLMIFEDIESWQWQEAGEGETDGTESSDEPWDE